MNLFDDGNSIEADIPSMELDAITGGVLDSGFIIDVNPTQVSLPEDRIIIINRSDLTFKEVTLRAMIGLYVLKEIYTSVDVNVYGISYTFELRANSVPNKADFVTVHRAMSKAISKICDSKESVNKMLDDILLEIQQDEWKFEE